MQTFHQGRIGIYTPKSVYLKFFMWLFCLLDPWQIRYRASDQRIPTQIKFLATPLHFIYRNMHRILYMWSANTWHQLQTFQNTTEDVYVWLVCDILYKRIRTTQAYLLTYIMQGDISSFLLLLGDRLQKKLKALSFQIGSVRKISPVFT